VVLLSFFSHGGGGVWVVCPRRHGGAVTCGAGEKRWKSNPQTHTRPNPTPQQALGFDPTRVIRWKKH